MKPLTRKQIFDLLFKYPEVNRIGRIINLSYGNKVWFDDHRIWKHISDNFKLSEDFMREFRKQLNWDCISRNQNLSEKFIKEMKNYIVWNHIVKYQSLSKEFIERMEEDYNIKENIY